MPIENYGRIMQDAAEFAAMPYNALMAGRKEAQQDEDDAEWDAAYAAQDWGRMARLDPQTTKILYEREQANKPVAPLEVQNLPGYGTVVTQGGQYKASRPEQAPTPPQMRTVYDGGMQVQQEFDPQTGQWREVGRGSRWQPQQAPQYAPTDVERNWRLRQSLPPDQRAEFDRLYGKGGATQDDATGGAGLNDRQKAGVNMQRANLIMYAANLTGLGRDEIERVLASEGPPGIERVIIDKGKRPLQGAGARFLQSFPLGKTVVEAKNADLIAPAKGGGAGIALLQNPTGPVATADFQAGEAQFPNATYPLETQAAMVRQGLEDADRMTGGGKQQTKDPLAQYAGQVIVQNGKRYQVIQGTNGKHFAQELK